MDIEARLAALETRVTAIEATYDEYLDELDDVTNLEDELPETPVDALPEPAPDYVPDVEVPAQPDPNDTNTPEFEPVQPIDQTPEPVETVTTPIIVTGDDGIPQVVGYEEVPVTPATPPLDPEVVYEPEPAVTPVDPHADDAEQINAILDNAAREILTVVE